MWQSFVCAMTAAVVLQAFDPFRSGKLVLYQVKYSIGWHRFELVPYAILGILGVRYCRCLVYDLLADVFQGHIWCSLHQTQHGCRPMEKGQCLAPRTHRSGPRCCPTHSSCQLSEPFYESPDHRARL